MRKTIQLSKADQYFVEHVTRISENKPGTGVYDDFGLEVRPVWQDTGEPAHTRYIQNVTEVYDLSKGELPIISLRPIKIDKAIGEALWIYRDASNNLVTLKTKYNIAWWDAWDIGDRTIGHCYGSVIKQHDLFNKLLRDLAADLAAGSTSRRRIMSLWQQDSLDSVHGLDPCAFLTDWSLVGTGSEPRRLSLTLVQRSNDYIAAGHINKMQYVGLQMAVARHLGIEVGTFTHFIFNLHIYDRHFVIAEEMLARANQEYPTPSLAIKADAPDIFNIMPKDFELTNYDPAPQFLIDIAV